MVEDAKDAAALLVLVRKQLSNAEEISTAGVTLSETVRELCKQNKCGQYGKNWTCPPAVKSVAEFREDVKAFDTFVVVYQVYDLKSNLDWRGMMAASGDFRDRLQALRADLEARRPQLRFLLLGAGGCRLCPRCSFVDKEPCRRPEDAVTSLEACGIDVMALMKDNGLKYYNGPSTVTYIGGLLYSKGQTP